MKDKQNSNKSNNSKIRKNNKIKGLFESAYSIIRWLHRVYPINNCSPKATDTLIAHLQRVFETRGPVEGIKYSKSLRLALIHYLLGSGQRVEGIAYTSNGVPKPVSKLLSKDGSNSPRFLAVLLTILTISRGIFLQSNPDIETITAPGKSGDVTYLFPYIVKFWRALGFRQLHNIPKGIMWSKFHYTSKNGPNGQALWTSIYDLIILRDCYPELLQDIFFVGGERLKKVMSSIIATLDLLPSWMKPGKKKGHSSLIRKLVDFPDKEGKTRIIAILDYWSQTALRPFHSTLLRILTRIPQDRTFSQGDFHTILKDAKVYYSIDLTAATDRFPMHLIRKVLEGRFPKTYVDRWANIMCKYPFDFHGSVKNYSVGNPMGAYSSWASFAIAHHFVVFYACEVTGVNWKTLPYALLGDDIVIGDQRVAEVYLRVISELGVEVSKQKTHISSHSFEFAKRWIHKGEEITPFPLHSLKEDGKRYYSLVNLLIEVQSKGWLLKCSIPEAIESFYTFVVKRPSRFRKGLETKVRTCECIMKIMRESVPATEMNNLIGQLGFKIPELRLEECRGILSNLAVELFALSNPENTSKEDKAKEKPLGLLAEQYLLYLTSEEWIDSIATLVDEPYSYPSYLPILACYGQVEEMYLDLKKKARRVDTIHEGEWPALLKHMLLPISDEAFYCRSSDMVPYASSILGAKLLERFELLQSPMGRRLLGR